MRNPIIKSNRNAKIAQDYNEMYFGQLMRDEAIFQALMEKYFLAYKTLYKIVLAESRKQSPQTAA